MLTTQTDNSNLTHINYASWQDKCQQLMKQLQLDQLPAGGSLVVYHRGQQVVSANIGYCKSSGSKIPANSKVTASSLWQADTLSMNYSTGKGVLATLVHILVSQGLLDYHTPICHYWSDFAKNGKTNVTLMQVMTHQAGLFDISGLIDTHQYMLSWQDMLTKIANMPLQPSYFSQRDSYNSSATSSHSTESSHSSKLDHSMSSHNVTSSNSADSSNSANATYTNVSTYSALVYGWILGGLVEAVTGRSLQQALVDYLTEPLGMAQQIFFGVPKALLSQVADTKISDTLKNQPKRQRLKPRFKENGLQRQQIYANLPCYPLWQQRYQSLYGEASEVLTTAQINQLYLTSKHIDLASYRCAMSPNIKEVFDYYDEEVLQAVIPAVNCVASANALAKMYAMLANGGQLDGHVYINPSVFTTLSTAYDTGFDRVMPAAMHWRLGYHKVFALPLSADIDADDKTTGFGHMGYNGSMAWCDPKRQLAVAFVHNYDTTMLHDIRQFAVNELLLAL